MGVKSHYNMHLKHLKHLFIANCPLLQCDGLDTIQDLVFLPKNVLRDNMHLKNLFIANCPHFYNAMDEDEVERRRQQEKGKDKVQWIDMYAKCGSLDDMSLFKMVAMGRRLGIDEPQLMKLMRAEIYPLQ
ncbi:hypothetical protein Sjap_015537 [Stephania japonica]|uniref:Uncharacterized protein n=1 Tax=Stephania japonica TaxID=461633 RepID=A0AAP0NSY0_9MAGN